ncbi:MAG: cation:proton antiporter, partial [Actinobacteria bacterium]|nr:cation:proton antiporter [Actinomycetota bacterium]
EPLYALFPSFFFVFIGASIELDALGGFSTLLLLAALTVLSFAVKYLACWFAARPLGRRDARIVALGMTPRGEVGSSSPGSAPPPGSSMASCLPSSWQFR